MRHLFVYFSIPYCIDFALKNDDISLGHQNARADPLFPVGMTEQQAI